MIFKFRQKVSINNFFTLFLEYQLTTVVLRYLVFPVRSSCSCDQIKGFFFFQEFSLEIDIYLIWSTQKSFKKSTSYQLINTCSNEVREIKSYVVIHAWKWNFGSQCIIHIGSFISWVSQLTYIIVCKNRRHW